MSWLKGFGKRKAAAHELEKTRIGLAVSLCRKQADPYVTKLADLLLQRRRQSSNASCRKHVCVTKWVQHVRKHATNCVLFGGGSSPGD